MHTLFTDMTIRTLPEGWHYDTKQADFAIRVGKRKKTWYVVKENRTKVSIGTYPETPLAQARKQAQAARAEPDKPSTPLFKEALEQFLEVHGKTLRPRSLYQLQRTLRRHFHWKCPVSEITHNDVSRAIEAITAPSEAAHAFKDIRTFFNWCVPRYLKHSPCAGLKTPSKYVPRSRLLSLGKWPSALPSPNSYMKSSTRYADTPPCSQWARHFHGKM